VAAEPVTAAARPCLNCGVPVERDYCPACGQEYEAAARLTHGGTFADVVAEFVRVEFASREFLRSLAYLLVRPGFLTTEYLAGRRVPYYTPGALFLLINGVYFLLLQWTGLPSNRAGFERALGAERMAAAARAQALSTGDFLAAMQSAWADVWPMASVLLVLGLMLVLELLYRKETFAFHAVFAFHYGAFVNLAGMAATLAGWLGPRWLEVTGALLLPALGLYLLLALRKAYGGGRLSAAVRAVVGLLALFVLMAGAGWLLAWVVFWMVT
jgi:hypothetical protein